jgi:hypothetical protein
VAALLFTGWGMLLHPASIVAEILRAGVPMYMAMEGVGLILAVEIVQLLRAAGPLRPRIAALPFWWRWSIYYAASAAALLLVPRTVAPFIYYAF